VSIGPGGSKYTVLQAIVDQYPGLKRWRLDPNNANAPIVLRDVDEDIGHTLIHYLYTTQYQTLALGSVPDEARIATEFKRSVLAYCAARLCGIESLEELTKVKIEELSQALSIFDLQRVAEEVATKLPRKGDWFSAQMNKWIKAALVADDSLLTKTDFLDAIGKSDVFDRAVVKGLIEMYGEQKAKNSNVNERQSPPDREEAIPATRDRARPNGIVTQGLPTHITTDRIQHVKPQLPQNGLGVNTQDLDEPATNKTPTDVSPIPSEEPYESPFEARRPSIGKSPETQPRTEIPIVKSTDSEVDPPKPPKAKKGKKKKGRKNDAAVGQNNDDEAQIGIGD
jgi:hypothetical protein